MSIVILYASLSAFLWSMVLVVLRLVMPRGADAKTLMIFNQLGAFALCLLLFGWPKFGLLDQSTVILLVLSGLSWALGVYLEVLALEHLEASASGVVGAVRYLLAIAVGIFFFQEHFTLLNALGALLVMSAVVFIGDLGKLNFRKGATLQFIAVFPQVIAYGLDKYLIGFLPSELVTTSAYLFCGMSFLVLFPKRVTLIPNEIRNSKYTLLFIPVGLAGCYYLLVTSFSLGGKFTMGMALVESSVIINWILGYLILKERDQALRKLVCCLVCFLGIVLIVN